MRPNKVKYPPRKAPFEKKISYLCILGERTCINRIYPTGSQASTPDSENNKSYIKIKTILYE